MTARPVTTAQLRLALDNLTLIAAPWSRPYGAGSRERLRGALRQSRELLDAPDAPQHLADPAQLIAEYIAAGGDWCALAAAVNAAALDGATRRKG